MASKSETKGGNPSPLASNVAAAKNNNDSTDTGAPKKRSFAVGGVACAPHLWAIHGKYYDMGSFVSQHPGGVEMIMLGKGRDCTEMFESIHCLSKRAVHKMLDKYEVPTPAGLPDPPQDTFSWEEDGFYGTVKRRVRNYFEERKISHKATPFYWLKISSMFCLWSLCIYNAFIATSLFKTMACAAAAGFIMNMLGFCAMHDGSHYGISKKPWVNKILHSIWSDWNLWSHFIWLRHHVYGHHSYTAIYRKDPDMVNIMPLVRKTAITRYNKAHKYQIFSAFMLLTFLPNQHVGQAVMYLKSKMNDMLFSTVPLEPCPKDVVVATTCIYILSVLFHFVLPFSVLNGWTAYFLILSYWTAQGIGYFINIAPNHDTLDTHQNLEAVEKQEAKESEVKQQQQQQVKENESENKQQQQQPQQQQPQQQKLRDWGVQQVIGSGNHTVDKGFLSTVVTQLWGGMNYQIEHHLFPAVSHMHYAAISTIVEKTCDEFRIPYVRHSWFTALIRFVGLINLLKSPTMSKIRNGSTETKKEN